MWRTWKWIWRAARSGLWCCPGNWVYLAWALTLLGREEDRYIPWDRVRRFGEDIILVEQEPRPARRRRT